MAPQILKLKIKGKQKISKHKKFLRGNNNNGVNYTQTSCGGINFEDDSFPFISHFNIYVY